MKSIKEDGTVIDIPEKSFESTWLQGYIEVTYAWLVDLFGPHEESDGYKTDAEWTLDTPAGPATIYNYKDGKNYNGPSGLAVERIRDWHVGGTNPKVVEWIQKALDVSITNANKARS